ncbi:MAG: regulatory protein GemA [Sneathiella sp.]|nr:regulatory protein GemA [Sneathiella sp.]
MTLSNKQISLIHIAKNQLKLSEQQYRETLHIGGAETSKKLDQLGFEIVMQILIAKGFKNEFNKSFFGHRIGMASPAQLYFIRKLWDEYTDGAGTEADLAKWLENSFKVSALRFLTSGHAQKVITALKKMKSRKLEKTPG